MISWTTDLKDRAAYETAARALGAEPSVVEEGDGVMRVSAELPDHYRMAIRTLIRGGVSPEAICPRIVECVAAKLNENK